MLNSYYIGPMGNPDLTDVIIAETKCTPFQNLSAAMSDWEGSFRSWPNVLLGWRNWYRHVSATKFGHWDQFGFAHCLNLSLDNLALNRPLLSAVSYFWSDMLSAFTCHGSLSPTPIDFFALTDLDVTSSANSSDLQILPHHRILTPHQYDING
jgi:hypothetical protein